MRSVRFCIAVSLLIAASLPLILLPPFTQSDSTATSTNVITQFAQTPLHTAIESNDIDRVSELLLLETTDINALDTSGWSPLVSALMRDSLEISKLLLQHGANIDYSYKRTETAQARELAASQYPVDLKSNEYLSNLDIDKELLEELTSQSMLDSMVNDMVDLHFALTKENAISHCESLETLQLIVEHGGNVNYVGPAGEWPLSSFAQFNNLPAVKWLLANGATPNTTSTGETAVFNAVSEDNIEMVNLLVASGANINAQDCDGWTPLCRTNSLTMAQLLLKLGADPNIRDQASMPCWDWVDDAAAKSFLKKSSSK